MSDQLPTGRKIGYARVSKKNQNIEMQLVALQNAGCEKIYTDVGISGRIFPRKGLSAALKALQIGNELVIHRLDRLGRNTLELLKLEQKLTARQIRLNSLMQPVDLSTASGKLSFIIFAAMAEHESNINGERTKGGLAVQRANGVRLGRPNKLNAEDIAIVQKMHIAESLPLSVIARTFDVSPNTIKRVLDA
jgi:DNA invertase Pin-like site-specific DNA recombinase